MFRRLFWFAVGAGVAVFASAKIRRIHEEDISGGHRSSRCRIRERDEPVGPRIRRPRYESGWQSERRSSARRSTCPIANLIASLDSSTQGTRHENRRDSAPLLGFLCRARSRSGAVSTPALQRSHPVVRQCRHGAFQAVLQRGRDPALRPRGECAEVRSDPRHRRGRQDNPPCHVLPDERELLLRRLLQSRGHSVRVGAGYRFASRRRIRV